MQSDTRQMVRMLPARKAKSFVSTLFHYTILLSLSFVFIYPMLYIVSQSLMQVGDITDATVRWIPKELSLEHYRFAFDRLHFWRSFTNSTVTSLGAALLQVISCAIVGYGFARYRFPGYRLLLGLVLFTFLLPPQTIVVPLYMFFGELSWINTYLPFLVPSAFGHGLRGALFVLIFIQFFRGLPNQLEESARIDGAGAFRTFRTIMLPLAGPAMLVVFLFSIVWHWNDVFEPNLYLMLSDHYNLPQSLMILDSQGEQRLSEAQKLMGGALLTSVPTGYNRNMAGALLTILPLIILYGYAQRYFVESLERTGIAGE